MPADPRGKRQPDLTRRRPPRKTTSQEDNSQAGEDNLTGRQLNRKITSHKENHIGRRTRRKTTSQTDEPQPNRMKMLGLNIFHKIHLKETRPLISNCMPKLDWQRKILLRSKGGYLPYDIRGDKFSKSFSPNIYPKYGTHQGVTYRVNIYIN